MVVGHMVIQTRGPLAAARGAQVQVLSREQHHAQGCHDCSNVARVPVQREVGRHWMRTMLCTARCTHHYVGSGSYRGSGPLMAADARTPCDYVELRVCEAGTQQPRLMYNAVCTGQDTRIG